MPQNQSRKFHLGQGPESNEIKAEFYGTANLDDIAMHLKDAVEGMKIKEDSPDNSPLDHSYRVGDLSINAGNSLEIDL